MHLLGWEAGVMRWMVCHNWIPPNSSYHLCMLNKVERDLIIHNFPHHTFLHSTSPHELEITAPQVMLRASITNKKWCCVICFVLLGAPHSYVMDHT